MPLSVCVQALYNMYLTQVLLTAFNVGARVPQVNQPTCFLGLMTAPVCVTDEEK